MVVAVTMSEKSYKAASDFGHTLFKYYLENNERPNSVISPISVFLCLAGLKQGAGGVTKAELVEALCLSVKGSGNEGQDVLKTLKSLPDDFNFSLNIANGLFLKEGFVPLPDFMSKLRSDLNAYVDIVNFESIEGVKSVNAWVEK